MADASVEADTSGLTGRVVGGIAWNVFGQAVVQVSRVVAGVVIARLLTPHDFGLAGMALVFGGLITTFTDLSLGAALVQRAQLTERDRSTVFWTTSLIGLACTGLGIAISGPVARFYGEPEVAKLFAVLSVTFVLTAISVTQTSLLTRTMEYRRLQLCGTVGILVGGAVGILVAALGYGPWAIIAQSVAGAAVGTLLVWLASDWRPQRIFALDSLRDVGGFGIKLFASRLLSYANLNADNMLVGRFLGARALGAYSLAYNVMFTPMLRLVFPINQAVAPAFARLQSDPPRLAAAWLRGKRLLTAALAPAFLGVAVVAPDLVPVVFGARWHRAVPVLQLLCLAGLAHSLITLNWSALQARGKAGTLLRLNLFVSPVILGAFVLGLHWGIVGVAGLFALAKWLLVLPDTWITSRGMEARTAAALRAGGAVLPVAVVMGALAWGTRLLLVAAGVPAAARLVIVIAVGVVAYPLLLRLVLPSVVAEFRALLGEKAAGRLAAARRRSSVVRATDS